jgi:hypothetical protein
MASIYPMRMFNLFLDIYLEVSACRQVDEAGLGKAGPGSCINPCPRRARRFLNVLPLEQFRCRSSRTFVSVHCCYRIAQPTPQRQSSRTRTLYPTWQGLTTLLLMAAALSSQLGLRTNSWHVQISLALRNHVTNSDDKIHLGGAIFHLFDIKLSIPSHSFPIIMPSSSHFNDVFKLVYHSHRNLPWARRLRPRPALQLHS